jgi:hypothetical protein
VRGEIRIKIRLEYFNNVNVFSDSSAGVQFFSSTHCFRLLCCSATELIRMRACVLVHVCVCVCAVSAPLTHYQIEATLGFTDELVLEDDPEYHWADTFRAARVSNTQRMLLLYNLSGFAVSLVLWTWFSGTNGVFVCGEQPTAAADR